MYSSCIFLRFFTLILICNVGSCNFGSITTTRQTLSLQWGMSGGFVWCTASAGRKAQSCSCSRWDLFTEVLWGTSRHKRSCHKSVQITLKEHLWYIETVLRFLHKVYLSVRLFLVYKTIFELDRENEYLRFTDTRSGHAFRLFCGVWQITENMI